LLRKTFDLGRIEDDGTAVADVVGEALRPGSDRSPIDLATDDDRVIRSEG
jgi:hypothetical protein